MPLKKDKRASLIISYVKGVSEEMAISKAYRPMQFATNVDKVIKQLAGIFVSVNPVISLYYFSAVILNLPRIMKKRSLIDADRYLKFSNFKFRIFGQTLVLDGAAFSAAREMYVQKVYWPNSHFKIRKDDIVIDLGANHGLFSLLAAKMGAKVLSVDCQSEFLNAVKKNLEINNCGEKANLLCAIVGSDSGLMASADELTRGSHFKEAPALLTMDELLKRYSLTKIDFLKMDIEGSEFSVFFSNTEWLTVTEKIAMEVHGKYGDPLRIVDKLEANGFTAVLTDSNLKKIINLNSDSGYIFAHRPKA